LTRIARAKSVAMLTPSLRVAVTVAILVFFAVVVLFLFFFLRLFSNQDIVGDKSITGT